MRALIDRFARWVRTFPLWIKLPLILMQTVALIGLFTWIYVTRSVETVRTPEVVGIPLDTARHKIAARGLGYRIIRRNSTQTRENNVMRQVPSPGKMLKETRQVELYVSKGPELVDVPDITGKSLFSAKNFLYRRKGSEQEAVGPLLNLGNIARVYHNETPEGVIFLQNPTAGQQVIRGSQVDVLVSKGPWPRRTVIPDLTGKRVPEARDILEANHLKAGNVRYVLQQDKPRSVVLRQSPTPGQIVRRGRPISLTVNLSETAEVDPKKYTFIRVTPPLSASDGRLKVELIDRRGTRTVFQDTVRPGREVKFLVSIRGSAKLIVYWNGEIYRFRRLEYQR